MRVSPVLAPDAGKEWRTCRRKLSRVPATSLRALAAADHRGPAKVRPGVLREGRPDGGALCARLSSLAGDGNGVGLVVSAAPALLNPFRALPLRCRSSPSLRSCPSSPSRSKRSSRWRGRRRSSLRSWRRSRSRGRASSSGKGRERRCAPMNCRRWTAVATAGLVYYGSGLPCWLRGRARQFCRSPSSFLCLCALLFSHC